ncbi:MAG: Asp/Glu racemase [Paracoccaceae bacterium]
MLTLPYELDTQRAPQIGLIVLQADETIERDMQRLLPGSVELLVSRVPSGTHVTPDSLAAMESELQHAASLLPISAQLSAVGYGCTSGTAQIGTDLVAGAIKAGTQTPHVTEPVSAAIAACRHLGVGRLGLLSPYIESVSDKLCEALSSANIEVCAFASFNESEERRVARITPASIRSAAAKLSASAEIDALFISCTNLRTLDVIAAIEADAGVPVLTSNQVLAWDLLRLAKIEVQATSAGDLWKRSDTN